MAKRNFSKNNVQAPSAPASAKPFLLQGWDIVACRKGVSYYCMPGQCFLFGEAYSKFKRSYCTLRFYTAMLDGATNRIVDDTLNMVSAPVNAFMYTGVCNMQYPGGVYDVMAPSSDTVYSCNIPSVDKTRFSSLISRTPMTADVFQSIKDNCPIQLGDPTPSQYPFLYVEKNKRTVAMFGSGSVCSMKVCSFDTMLSPSLVDKDMVRTNIPILLQDEWILASSGVNHVFGLRYEHQYWYTVYSILNRLGISKFYIGFGPVDPTTIVCDSIMDEASFEAFCAATNNPANTAAISKAAIKLCPNWDCPRSLFRIDEFNPDDPLAKMDYLRSVSKTIIQRGILPQEKSYPIY